MGICNVTQFADMEQGSNGAWMQVAKCPEVTSENVTTSGTAAASAAFHVNTTVVRIATDTAVYVAIGDGPTAAAGDMLMAADTVEYFGVQPGHNVSVIDK